MVAEDTLRFGFGFGAGLFLGDLGVWGESAARPGVGGFAGVDAEVGGVDEDATLSEATGSFFFRAGTGVACAACVLGLGCDSCGVGIPEG